MQRLLLAASLLIVQASSALAYGPPEPAACCACQGASSPPALFCSRVPVDDLPSLVTQCDSQGGVLKCASPPIGDTACTFENLNCPAAPAPALDSASLGALAVVLAGVGVITVRRRARR